MLQLCACPICRAELLIEPLSDSCELLRCPGCQSVFMYGEVMLGLRTAPLMAVSLANEQTADQADISATEPAPAHGEVTEIEHVDALTTAAPIAEPEQAFPPALESTDTATIEDIPAPAPAHVNVTTTAYAAVDAAREAWSHALASAEGASFLETDFDDPEVARPWHEDPAYDARLTALDLQTAGADDDFDDEDGGDYEDDDYEDDFDELSFDPAEPAHLNGDDGQPSPGISVAADAEHAWPQAEPSQPEGFEFQSTGWSNQPAPDGDWGKFGRGSVATLPIGVAETGEYGLAGGEVEREPAETGTMAPDFQSRPRRRRKSSVGILGPLIQLFGIAGGGVVGLALGYLILLWIGGPAKDFLKIRHEIPSFLLPSDFGATSGSKKKQELPNLLDVKDDLMETDPIKLGPDPMPAESGFTTEP